MRAAPDWYPDWRGEACAIVASGPSITKADVHSLKGRMRVIAVKRNVDLAPFADVVYGCDAAWWRNVNGLPKFDGLKVCATRRSTEHLTDLRQITVESPTDRLLLGEPGILGSGGNSGFQALNLAVQFGARRILLLGVDCDGRAGVHWYGRNSGAGQSNPGEINFRRWRRAFEEAAPQLEAIGAVVVNASTISSLTCFPRASVSQTLEAWAECTAPSG